MTGASQTSRLSSLARALVAGALVAAAGAVVVAVTEPATNGVAQPQPAATTTSATASTPSASARRADCTNLTLARISGTRAADPVTCHAGEYRTDSLQRLVLSATCSATATWRSYGVSLRTGAGVIVAPECDANSVPSATPARSARPSDTAGDTDRCTTLVAGVRAPTREPAVCRFSTTTIVTVAASSLDAIRSETSYVLVDSAGHEVELAP